MDVAKLALLLFFFSFFRSNLGTCGIKSDQTIKMKMVVRNIFFYWCVVPAAGQSGVRNVDYLFSKILYLDRGITYH